MQRSDWLAVLLALFGLGAGAYLNTFPAEIIRGIGLILMAAAIFGIIIWFAIERGNKIVNTFGPWILIIGGPIAGAIWLYLTVPSVFGIEPKRTTSDQPSHVAQTLVIQGRHLNEDSKARLRTALRISSSESYSFQINTLPSCDECEQFAEELRDFINTVPGWQASGGPLMWTISQFRYGMFFVSHGNDQDSSVAKKVFNAFRDAGLPLTPHVELQMKQGEFTIVIGRQS